MNKLFPSSNTEQERVLAAITKLIHDYCNTTFEPTPRVSEKYDSISEIVLDHRPILSVLSVTDNGVHLEEDAETTGFFVYEERIILTDPSRKRKGVVISYTSGFYEVPPLVEAVALELARYRLFQETEKGTLFYKTQKMEERAYEIDEELSELKILSKLSRWVQPISSSLKRGGGPLRLGVM
jgi:hypothetical protein